MFLILSLLPLLGAAQARTDVSILFTGGEGPPVLRKESVRVECWYEPMPPGKGMSLAVSIAHPLAGHVTRYHLDGPGRLLVAGGRHNGQVFSMALELPAPGLPGARSDIRINLAAEAMEKPRTKVRAEGGQDKF